MKSSHGLLNKINVLQFAREKTVLFILKAAVFFLCLIAILSIFITYIYSSISPEESIYQTVASRLSIFLLGSIVTMSVFTYNSKQKMSSIEFLNNKLPYFMLIGITLSLLTILTVPIKIYMPNTFIWEKLFSTEVSALKDLIKENLKLDSLKNNLANTKFVFQIPSILSVINLISFISSLLIFCLILYNFILSFYIKIIIDRNYKSILNKGKIKKYRTIDSTEIAAKLNEEQCIYLEKKLEVFYQNLIYLISLNHSTLVNDYLDKWREVTSTIYLLIFHSNLEDDEFTERKKLYNKMLGLTSDLILKTSEDISHKENNIHLINSLIGALPTQEQYFIDSKDVYEKMSKDLSESYFKQVYNLFNYLYESSNKKIYTMILNDEVHFIEKIRSVYKQNHEYGREDITSIYVQDIFLSAIFKCITSKSDDLTTILGLLFITQDNYTISESPIKENEIESDVVDLFKALLSTGNTSNSSKPIEASEKKLFSDFFYKFKKKPNGKIIRDKINNVVEVEKDEISISPRIIENLIIAIAKACEIENYAAAGYLVKRICNHLDFGILESAYQTVFKELTTNNSKELRTSIISLNPYSVKYCLEKAFFLIFLQLAYNSKYKFDYNYRHDLLYNFLDLISEENKMNFIDTLKDRKKDYNLSCISEENFDKFGDYLGGINQLIIFGNLNLFVSRNSKQ